VRIVRKRPTIGQVTMGQVTIGQVLNTYRTPTKHVLKVCRPSPIGTQQALEKFLAGSRPTSR